ncbi:hypothetical protein PPM_p0053 (plasmid) [Paenibacillus polymyxa M1]|uniref:hypothetical protein n=1 Tax=Paenibacillus polymyxa TaxID=1406 RepID=UPI00021BBB21|nr:hypothetical protein [Paenibacillus polymyxa]CCC86203.1 hypothetical protein PPM_p0053 [Paenibacillus polymyxa M1]
MKKILVLLILLIIFGATACSNQDPSESYKQIDYDSTSTSEVTKEQFVLKKVNLQYGNQQYTNINDESTSRYAFEQDDRLTVSSQTNPSNYFDTPKIYMSVGKDGNWVSKDLALGQLEQYAYAEGVPGGFIFADKESYSVKYLDSNNKIQVHSFVDNGIDKSWKLDKIILTSKGYALKFDKGDSVKLILCSDYQHSIDINIKFKFGSSERFDYQYIDLNSGDIVATADSNIYILNLKTGEPQFDDLGQPKKYPLLLGDFVGRSKSGQWLYVEHSDDIVRIGYLDDELRFVDYSTIEGIPHPHIGDKYFLDGKELRMIGTYKYRGKDSIYEALIDIN